MDASKAIARKSLGKFYWSSTPAFIRLLIHTRQNSIIIKSEANNEGIKFVSIKDQLEGIKLQLHPTSRVYVVGIYNKKGK